MINDKEDNNQVQTWIVASGSQPAPFIAVTGSAERYCGSGDTDTIIDLSHNQITGNPSFLTSCSTPQSDDKVRSVCHRPSTSLTWPKSGVSQPPELFNRAKSKSREGATSLKDIKLHQFSVSINELCGESVTYYQLESKLQMVQLLSIFPAKENMSDMTCMFITTMNYAKKNLTN